MRGAAMKAWSWSALAGLTALLGCREPSVAGTDAGNAGKVAGVVVDGQDRPVANAAVYLRTSEYQPSLDNGSVSLPARGKEWISRTGKDGEFAFTLDPNDTGLFVVESITEGIRGGRAVLHRKTGRALDAGKIRLVALGRITGKAGLPPGNVGDVLVTLPGSRNLAYLAEGSEAFDFQSLPAGDYTVRVQGLSPLRGPKETRISLQPADTLSLGLVAGEAAAGSAGTVSVRLARPGNAGGTLYAKLSGSAGAVAADAADAAGHLAFKGVPPGVYSLSAWGENPARDTMKLEGIVVAPGRLTGPLDLAFRIKALIVDGIANHDWPRMTGYNRTILEASGLFEVAVSTTPPDKAAPDAWAAWQPRFADYDVVILHCNSGYGDDGKANPWPDSVKKSLEDFVSAGGGLVNTQATFPGFLGWPAFEAMHGLVWRNVDYQGPGYALDSLDSLVSNPAAQDKPSHEVMTPGGAGELIGLVNPTHPLNQGLPARWRHPPSNLAYHLKGDPAGMTVLSYSWNPVTGEREAQTWTKDFGRGRAYTTIIGDLAMGATNISLRCAGYQTTFIRGAEWAATGKVTFPVPGDFPGPDSASLRDNLKD